MEDLRRRLDLFQKIYESWGFQKQIRSWNAFDYDPTMLPDFCSEDLQQPEGAGYRCVIDLQEVLSKTFAPRKNEFYISFRNPIRPLQCVGGRIEQYETHRNFRTYKVLHEAKCVEILLL